MKMSTFDVPQIFSFCSKVFAQILVFVRPPFRTGLESVLYLLHSLVNKQYMLLISVVHIDVVEVCLSLVQPIAVEDEDSSLRSFAVCFLHQDQE